jgi:hypothetical protein
MCWIYVNEKCQLINSCTVSHIFWKVKLKIINFEKRIGQL